MSDRLVIWRWKRRGAMGVERAISCRLRIEGESGHVLELRGYSDGRVIVEVIRVGSEGFIHWPLTIFAADLAEAVQVFQGDSHDQGM